MTVSKLAAVVAVGLFACGGKTVNDAKDKAGSIGVGPWDTVSTTNHDRAHAAPIMDGGPDGWRRAEGTVAPGAPQYWSVTFGPHPPKDLLTMGDVVAAGTDVIVEATIPGDPTIYQISGPPVPGDAPEGAMPPLTPGETVTFRVSTPPATIDSPDSVSYEFGVADSDASDDGDDVAIK